MTTEWHYPDAVAVFRVAGGERPPVGIFQYDDRTLAYTPVDSYRFRPLSRMLPRDVTWAVLDVLKTLRDRGLLLWLKAPVSPTGEWSIVPCSKRRCKLVVSGKKLPPGAVTFRRVIYEKTEQAADKVQNGRASD